MLIFEIFSSLWGLTDSLFYCKDSEMGSPSSVTRTQTFNELNLNIVDYGLVIFIDKFNYYCVKSTSLP